VISAFRRITRSLSIRTMAADWYSERRPLVKLRESRHGYIHVLHFQGEVDLHRGPALRCASHCCVPKPAQPLFGEREEHRVSGSHRRGDVAEW